MVAHSVMNVSVGYNQMNVMIIFIVLVQGVRTALLESEENECPDCNEKGSSPGSLIPNRFLRNSVNSFKNETGYTKQRPTPSKRTIFID